MFALRAKAGIIFVNNAKRISHMLNNLARTPQPQTPTQDDDANCDGVLLGMGSMRKLAPGIGKIFFVVFASRELEY